MSIKIKIKIENLLKIESVSDMQAVYRARYSGARKITSIVITHRVSRANSGTGFMRHIIIIKSTMYG